MTLFEGLSAGSLRRRLERGLGGAGSALWHVFIGLRSYARDWAIAFLSLGTLARTTFLWGVSAPDATEMVRVISLAAYAVGVIALILYVLILFLSLVGTRPPKPGMDIPPIVREVPAAMAGTLRFSTVFSVSRSPSLSAPHTRSPSRRSPPRQ